MLRLRGAFSCLPVAVLMLSRPALAGLGDTPLPTFSDSKSSVQILAVSGVVKRTPLDTEFICTSFDSVPVDIGVEVFDNAGALQNSVGADVGAVLNVGSGQTVTIGTAATAAFLETTTIPLASISQGSARVVASSINVSCNVLTVDNGVSPPNGLATLAPGVQPVAGALPSTIALPTFADAIPATHAAIVPGVVKRSRSQTNFFCTSLAATNIDVGVEIFTPAGTVANSVAAGNGAVLNVTPGQTVTFGTTGTAAFFETQVISLSGIAQGMARIVSNSNQLLCSSLIVDSGVTPPVSGTDLTTTAANGTPASMPAVLPTFSDSQPSVAVMVIPGVTSRAQVQTDFLCTNTASSAVVIGVQVFNAAGVLANDISAGQGAILNVAAGQTVTFGTSGTAAFLESALIPLPVGFEQGSARVVASATGVRCNALLVDSSVNPSTSLATLREGMRPSLGAAPTSIALPTFANAHAATHSVAVPGIAKRGSLEMAFLCTSLATGMIDVGVEIFGTNGTVQNSIAGANGAILDVAPGRTVTIATSGTAAFLDDALITTAGISQGMARIVSNSGELTCAALMLDAGVTPPTSMTSLLPSTVSGGPPGPTATRTATPTETPTRTATLTPTPTATPFSEDVFKLYKSKVTKGSAAFVPPAPQTLADDFETKLTLVNKPLALGNPSSINGQGVSDATIHLECDSIKDDNSLAQPRFAGRRVQIANQLGAQTLDVLKSKRLCVPSLTDPSAPPPPSLPPHNVDHFKCYKAKRTSGGFATLVTTIADTFESKVTNVLKPVEVCSPVSVDGSALVNPAIHLTCYMIKDARTPAQAKFVATNVYSQNEYGAGQRTALKAQELCVPSTLTDLGALP